MNRITAAVLFFGVFPAFLFAGTNTGFTLTPKNGSVILNFNQSDVKNIRDIRKIYQDLEDKTCLEFYKRSRTKYVLGFGVSMLGAVAMGLGIGDAMSSGAPRFGKSGDLILFISGDITAIIGLFLVQSSSKDMIRSVEYYNDHQKIAFSAKSINYNSIF